MIKIVVDCNEHIIYDIPLRTGTNVVINENELVNIMEYRLTLNKVFVHLSHNGENVDTILEYDKFNEMVNKEYLSLDDFQKYEFVRRLKK